MKIPQYETVAQVAERLSLSERRIRVLCEGERFEPKAEKIGRDWLIPKGAMPTTASSGPPPTWTR